MREQQDVWWIWTAQRVHWHPRLCIICALENHVFVHIISNTYFSELCCSHPPFHNICFWDVQYMEIACVLSTLLFPLLNFWRIEINRRCWHKFFTDWDKNTLLWVSHNGNVHLLLWYHSLTLISPFPHSFSPPFYCSSLYSPPALSRAVMGLDRESDVVHIETRIAKGRECCTPVYRSS